MSMRSRMFVLIIGVDQYSDPAVPGLKGSRNDAIAWYKFCTEYLFVPPENIAVLASPKLTVAELGPSAKDANLVDATRTDILSWVSWLAGNLAPGNATGLMTYSGHSAVMAEASSEQGMDLAICPSDVAIVQQGGKSVLQNGISFAALSSRIPTAVARENLTIFLDTCYAGSSVTVPIAGSSRRLLNVAVDDSAQVTEAGRVAQQHRSKLDPWYKRLILGAERSMVAYEISTDQGIRGAASFAATNLMRQWSQVAKDGVVFLNVTYADFVHRMRNELEVLGVPQEAALWGPRVTDDVAVFQLGLVPTGVKTLSAPDGIVRQIPIDPNKITEATIRYNSIDLIRVVITNNSSVGSFSTGKEYWYYDSGKLTEAFLGDPEMIFSSATNDVYDSSQVASFLGSFTQAFYVAQVLGTGDWTEGTYTPGEGNNTYLFRAPNPDNEEQDIYLMIETNGDDDLVNIIWYKSTVTSGTIFGTTPASIEFEFIDTIAGPASGTWYYANPTHNS